MPLLRLFAIAAATLAFSPIALALKSPPSLTLTSYPSKPVSGQVLRYQATWRAGTGTPCFGDLVINLPSTGVTFQSSNPGGSYNGSNQVRWSGIRFHNNSGSRWVDVVVNQGSGALPAASAQITGGCSAGSGNIPGPDVTPGAAPILTLDKKASLQNANPGDQIVYTLSYENTGNSDATGVVLTDPLPANTSFVSATGGGTEALGTVTWNIGTVPAGTTSSLSATVKVNSPLANGTVLSNSASLNSNELPVVNAGPVTTTVTSEPILSYLKLAPSTHVSAGQQFTFTIPYGNTGTDTATGLVLTDTLPPELTFISASSSGTHANGVVTWNLPDLGAGGAHQVSLTVQAASPIADGTVLSNDVVLTSTQTGVLPAQSADVTVDSRPILELDKTVSRTSADAGDQLVYTLSYRNIGSDTATNVQLQDVLPPDTTYVSDTAGGSRTGQQIDWNLGSLAAGASGSLTLTADINSPIANGTTLHNTASVESDRFTIPATAFADTIVSSAPSFSISKTASKPQVQAGDTVVYTIAYQNTGTDDATVVVLEDALPGDVMFVSATGGGTYDAGTNRVTWNKGTVAAGVAGSVQLTVEVDNPIPNGTLLKNTASIDSNETAPLTADVNQSIVKVSSEPDLTLDLIPSVTQTSPGNTIVYTLNFANIGSDVSVATRLNFTTPAGTTISTANAGGVVSGSSVTWTIGDLLAGGSGSTSVTVTVDSPLPNGTRLGASSSIKETGGHSDVANAVTTVVSAPVLQVTKTASRSTANPGDTLVYTINYSNTGTDQATTVLLGDALPSDVTFVSASGGGTLSGGVVNWQVGTLAAGGSGTETVTVTVNSPLSNGTQLYNVGAVSSDQTGVLTDQNVVTVNSAPSLSITKTASKTVAKPGDTIIYTIDYANTGTDQATNVTIEDHLPADTTFVSASAGGTETTTDIVDWTIGTVAAGVSGSVTVEATVDSPLANGTVLHNTASIDSTETVPLSTGNIDVTVSSAPVLIFGKTGPSFINAGGQLTYSLNYRNIGNDTATALLVEDHLPPETSFVAASAGGVHTGGVVDWSLPDLPAGGSGSVTVTVDVNSPLPNGTLLHNQASVDSAETAPFSAQWDTQVTSSPILTMVKSASQSTVIAGSQFTYTLDYSNSGNANASNVVIVDHLPPELTFISATSAGTLSGSDVIWNISSVTAGSSGSVSVTVEVNSPISDGIVIPNTSNIRGDGVPPSVAPLVPVTVSSTPAFTLDKTVSSTTVAAGAQVTYTLDYFNQGTDQATNVVLSDQVPTNTTFVSASAGGTEAGGVVTWNLGTVPAQTGSSVSVTLLVADPLPNGTQVDNQAEITSSETPPLTDSASFVVTSAPTLQLTKSSQPGTVVQAGDTETYTLVLENTGSDAANSVVVEDVIPAASTPSNISAGGAFSAASSSITWNIPSLAAGASVNLGYELLVPIGVADGTAWTNNASATATNASPVSVSNSVTVAAQPVLSITKSGGNSVNAGENLAYTISYENTGNATAQNAVIEDIIPAGLSFVSADNGGVESGGVVTWNVGDVAPGASGTLTLTLSAPLGALDGTVYNNISSVSATNGPPASAQAQTVVRSHVELEVTIVGSPTSVAPAGQAIFQINYANLGNENAPNAVLRATLPANTTFSSATGGGSPSGAEVVWNLGTLNAGGSGTVEFTVDVASPLTNGTSLPSTATLTSDLGQPDSANAAVTVSSSPLVIFVKASDADEARVGQTLEFGIGIANFGNAVATNVVITDTLPAELEILSADSGGVIDSNANTVTWNIGDVPPDGNPVIVTVQTRLTSRIPAVVNAATISYTELGQPFTLSLTVPVAAPPPQAIPAVPPLFLLLLALMMVAGAGATLRMRTDR